MLHVKLKSIIIVFTNFLHLGNFFHDTDFSIATIVRFLSKFVKIKFIRVEIFCILNHNYHITSSISLNISGRSGISIRCIIMIKKLQIFQNIMKNKSHCIELNCIKYIYMQREYFHLTMCSQKNFCISNIIPIMLWNKFFFYKIKTSWGRKLQIF